MKILQICAAYKPAYIYGGPTMSVSLLSEQLHKAGENVEVYATTANGKTELPVISAQPVKVDGVTVTYFKRLTKDHTHFSPAMLKSLWTKVPDVDVIHIHAWWNLVSVFSCCMALIRKKKVLISPRGTLSFYSFQNKNTGIKQIIHQLLGKTLLNKSHIHVTSQHEYDAVINLITPKSITLLPNFIKLGDEKYPARSSHDVLKLLFFSRIQEKKGLDVLIESLPLITVPFTLTIAGYGEQQYINQLKNLAAHNRVADKITWAGFRGDDKFDVLNRHDLFVLPSWDENFGNAVIESLSVGTPVLISHQVGLADYVLKNRLGWVCQTDNGSVADMINHIAINGKNDIDRINETSAAIIHQDFNESVLVKKYEQMYNQIIKA